MSKSRALRELMTAVDAGHVVMDTTTTSSEEASFEFSAFVSNSSASPASMVFSDGQLRAHQYPAVRSSAAGRSQAASMPTSAKAEAMMGSKKRVSFAMDGSDKAATKAGDGQGKKSGGLLGCMGSACGSSRSEVVEPAKNANRKVVAV